MTGFTSPFAIPVGTYTPLETEASADGGAKAAEVGTTTITSIRITLLKLVTDRTTMFPELVPFIDMSSYYLTRKDNGDAILKYSKSQSK